MPTMNRVRIDQMAQKLRTGPLFEEITTNIKRLRLNGPVTEENIRKLLDESEIKGIPIDLTGKDLTNLRGSRLFLKRDLTDANFTDVKAVQLDFSEGSLFRAILTRARISKSTFRHTDITSMEGWNAEFQFSNFENVIGLERVKHLGTIKFYGSDLSDADKVAILAANPNIKLGYSKI